MPVSAVAATSRAASTSSSARPFLSLLSVLLVLLVVSLYSEELASFYSDGNVPDGLPVSAAEPGQATAEAAGTIPAEDSALRLDLYRKGLARLDGLAKEHRLAQRPQAVGFRGVSFVHSRLGGAVLGSPDVARMVQAGTVRLGATGKLQFAIENLAPGPCNSSSQLNRVSIWVRIAGPEISAQVARPVRGECKWLATFAVTIPGEYTIYARLLHYNAHQDALQSCEYVKDDGLRLVLLADAPLIPYHARGHEKCCVMCSRVPGCEYSIRPFDANASASPLFTQPVQVKNAQCGEDRCIFMRRARSAEEPGSFLAADAFRRFNIVKQPPEACRSFLPNPTGIMRTANTQLIELEGPVHQLGCGRDELLSKWVPCGTFGHSAPVAAALMPQTEDVVLFEHDGKVRIALHNALTAEHVIADAIAPRGSKARPACSWSEGVPVGRGRWVRIPDPMLASCSPQHSWMGTNWNSAIMPAVPAQDPPHCYSRWNLERIPTVYQVWGDLNVSALFPNINMHVWRSELSDSYLRNQTRAKLPHVPGPVAAQWVLDEDLACRKPPWMNAAQLRECIVSKQIKVIEGRGMSIMEFTFAALRPWLRAAFPEEGEMSPGDSRTHEFVFNVSGAALQNKVFISNLGAPHLVGSVGKPMTEIVDRRAAWELEGSSKSFLAGVSAMRPWKKIFFTPGFSPWERWPYQHWGRYDALAERVRTKWLNLKSGWIEVDYAPLTRAFAYESSPEQDSLHFVGPALAELAQLILSAICADG